MLRRCSRLVLLGLLCCGWAAGAAAQESPQTQVANADLALQHAHSEQVDVLAPRNFQRAVEALQEAKAELAKSGKPNRIDKRLADLQQALAQATKAAAVGRVALGGALKTRQEAMNADAAKFAPEDWRRAVERFEQAATESESGDVKGAQRRGSESEVLFREAELAAIKGNLLNEARALIRQADDAKAGKLAPRTLEAAKHYLAQAEAEITQNRYDADLPRTLAQQAAYEARHAMYLASLIKTAQSQDQGLEALILSWEEPLKKIAAQVDLIARFDESYDKPMQQLLEHVNDQRQKTHNLEQELGDRDGQIAGLESEIKRLEDKLGGVSQERIALQKRVDAQAQLRANVAKVESLFTPAEARTYRESDNVILSLTGINFPVGKSTIEASNVALMNKVQEALALFPGAAIVVEGHTDSFGSDSANLLLSQDRADAVKQYLIANMKLDAEKVSSVGYGETRPVATNDTAEGRARNRRIDLVIRLDTSGL